MSLLNFLQLQPIDSQDGTDDDLNQYEEDEVFDLSSDPDGDELTEEWERITSDLHE